MNGHTAFHILSFEGPDACARAGDAASLPPYLLEHEIRQGALAGKRAVILAEERALSFRRAARATARHYAWPEVVRRNLLPQIELADR